MKAEKLNQHPRFTRNKFDKLHLIMLIAITFYMGMAFAQEKITINNPYEGVSWDLKHRHKANLHTHTTNSDGTIKPHDVVDAYKKLGYSALAITDHDKLTYPWTEFSKIKPFKDQKSTVEERSGYEDRDPEKVGMTDIIGNEISREHHMVNLWTDTIGGAKNKFPQAQILDSKEKGGQIIFAHPGRYGWNTYEKRMKDAKEKAEKKGGKKVEEKAEDEHQHDNEDKGENKVKDAVKDNDPATMMNKSGWWLEKYIYVLKEHKNFIGMEVYNAGDRYPKDRILWDLILTELMPERLVWGFSNDDMHKEEQLGRNQTILLIKEPTDEQIKNALAKGQFFFAYCPKAKEGSKPPTIENISVDNEKLTISVKVDEAKKIEWISNGEIVGEGETLELSKVAKLGNYVRVMIYGTKDDTVIGTQPFGIVRKK